MITVKEIDARDIETLECGFSNSPFGRCFIATWHGNVVAFSFVGKNNGGENFTDYLSKRWSCLNLHANNIMATDIVRTFFGNHNSNFTVGLCGTHFQNKVWKALVEIPFGTTVAYLDIAKKIGMPTAVRAVASAIAANEIAVLVPCHRVKRLNGHIGQYRWGVKTKISLLEYEKQYTHN